MSIHLGEIRSSPGVEMLLHLTSVFATSPWLCSCKIKEFHPFCFVKQPGLKTVYQGHFEDVVMMFWSHHRGAQRVININLSIKISNITLMLRVVVAVLLPGVSMQAETEGSLFQSCLINPRAKTLALFLHSIIIRYVAWINR
jgi:hypothetical protein